MPKYKIELDGTLGLQEIRHGTKINGQWRLTTPFDSVRSLTLEAGLMNHTYKVGQNIAVALNEEGLLDVDTEYSWRGKHRGALIVREPVNMKYSVSVSYNPGITDAELYANWNR